MDRDLKSKTFGELERLVVGLGQKKYIAGYIFGFIHTKGVTDISAITPLSKSFRTRLTEQEYYISALQVVEKLTDPDGTVKYVFGLPDGKRIESVLLFDPVKSKRFPAPWNPEDSRDKVLEISKRFQRRLSPGNSPVEFKEFPGPSPRNPKGIPEGKGISQGDGRRTLCVSTQAGCAMGCVFCATGRLGLKRNLTTAEIVDQVNLVSEQRTADSGQKRTERCTLHAERCITNVVFMGMGEPLANYEAVLDAVRILNHPEGRKIGIRHITISTCGLPEGIERLADEDIQPASPDSRPPRRAGGETGPPAGEVSPKADRTSRGGPRLAISLNAPTDAIRQKLMPIAKRYPLDRLFRAVEVYQHKTHNRVTFEYCMIKGVNDTVLHARLLVKRLHPVRCNVNLIEYNPNAGCNLRPGGTEAIERFANTLRESGIETTVRLKMGQTINAACGQLGAVL